MTSVSDLRRYCKLQRYIDVILASNVVAKSRIPRQIVVHVDILHWYGADPFRWNNDAKE